jgi:predicted nucleic acid-binding protein
MMTARFAFLLSTELLGEYRAVLLRPKIRSRHRLDEREIGAVLTELVVNARFRKAVPTSPARVSCDDHLRALLDVEPGSALVTGDRPLATELQARDRVFSPRDFVALLA